jgi:hypothetical protein
MKKYRSGEVGIKDPQRLYLKVLEIFNISLEFNEGQTGITTGPKIIKRAQVPQAV